MVCVSVAVGVGTKIINNQEGPVTHNKWQFADRPGRMETSTRTRIKLGS